MPSCPVSSNKGVSLTEQSNDPRTSVCCSPPDAKTEELQNVWSAICPFRTQFMTAAFAFAPQLQEKYVVPSLGVIKVLEKNKCSGACGNFTCRQKLKACFRPCERLSIIDCALIIHTNLHGVTRTSIVVTSARKCTQGNLKHQHHRVPKRKKQRRQKRHRTSLPAFERMTSPAP